MKIMVMGHSGMLGKEVHQAVIRMGHHLIIPKVDIAHKIIVQEHGIEIVINCAGLVPQRLPPPTLAEMMWVNGYGPWNLADWCDQIGARLIHISTDCVFDGRKYQPDSDPYLEHHLPKPATPYGYSKLAGEIYREPHLTVRTSFVGYGKQGLLEELLQCHRNGKVYKASVHQFWTGHTTRFVAETLVLLAEGEIAGLLHIPGEPFNRHELVKLLAHALDLDFGISRELAPGIDRRLGSERWEREGLPDLPSFRWQLEWLRRSQ